MGHNHTIEDVLNDSEFIHWIKQNPNSHEWEAFKMQSQIDNEDLELVREIITHTALSQPNSNPDTQKHTWDRIEHHIQQSSPKKIRPYVITGVLALLLTVFAGIYLNVNSDDSHLAPQQNEQDYWVEYTNTGNTNWPIDLSDGSQVILEPNSKLKYPRLFDSKTRKVQLTGDAFFDISTDTLKPFYVYANEAVIRVLGTSFFVEAEDEDKDVKVIVKTGKVAVYKGKEIKEYQNKKIAKLTPLMVTPNQVATLDKSTLQMDKRLISRPTLTRSLKQIKKTYFEDRPISEITLALKDAYGVEIILDAGITDDCRLTTTLSNQPLFEFLKVICDPLGLQYYEKDVTIHIRGNCLQ